MYRTFSNLPYYAFQEPLSFLALQILHKHSFQFVLVSREIGNNASAKFWRKRKKKEYYGKFERGILAEVQRIWVLCNAMCHMTHIREI